MRDDVKQGFQDNWESDSPIPNAPIPNDPGNPNQLRADCEGWKNIDNAALDSIKLYNESNVESLDHLTTILLGLRFVEEMVPNAWVQPTVSDEGMYIHDEALDMIQRIVYYLNDTEENSFGQFSAQEWTLKIEDEIVHNAGFNCMIASYPIQKMIYDVYGAEEELLISEPGEISLRFREDEICQDISNSAFVDAVANAALDAGGSWVLSEFTTPVLAPIGVIQGGIWGAAHCGNPDDNESVAGPIPIEIMNATIRKIWERLESHEIPLHADASGFFIINTSDMFIKVDGIPTALPAILPIPLTDKMTDDDNVHIMLELATLGHVWGPEYVRSLAYPSHLDHIPLLYDALFTNPIATCTDKPRSHYYDLLSMAPCTGPYADPYSESNVAAEWASSNRLFHPGDRNLGARVNGVIDPEYRGYFPGIDYMVMYNAYHLLWKDELPPYQRVANCECVAEITSAEITTTAIVVTPKFPDYKTKGIPIESYLAHDLTVSTTTGELIVKNDLIVCRENPLIPTTLTIDAGATMKLYDGNTITIREGNKIILSHGAHFIGGIADPDMPANFSPPQAVFHLEKNAEFHVLSGSLFEHYYGGVTIRLDEGAKFIVDDAEVLINGLGQVSHYFAHGTDAEIIVRNNSQFTESFPFAVGSTSNIDGGARLTITDSNMNINHGFWNLDELAMLTVQNTSLTLPHGGFTLTNESVANIDNSTLELYQAHGFVDGGSELHLNTSVLRISAGGSLNIWQQNGVDLPAKFFYDQSEVQLVDDPSKLSFSGGLLFIPSNQTFTISHENEVSGFIEILPGTENMLVTGVNSTFALTGSDMEDVVLRIAPGAHLQNPNFGAGAIKLLTCKVDMTGGHIYTDMLFSANHVNFHSDGDQGSIWVWYSTDVVSHCLFNHCHLAGRWSKNTVQLSEFTSGEFSFIGGGFSLAHNNFMDSDGWSAGLQYVSQMNNCNFSGQCTEAFFEDESETEVLIRDCIFSGENDQAGVAKRFGKISIGCSSFSGLNAGIAGFEGALINMSAMDNAGYNSFDLCDRMIFLDKAYDLNLTRGYNDFSQVAGQIIFGDLQSQAYACTGVVNNGCEPEFDASYNVWPGANTPPAWPVNDLTGTGDPCGGSLYPTCAVTVVDFSPTDVQACPDSKPVLEYHKTIFSGITSLAQQVVKEKIPLQTDVAKDYDPGNPMLFTSDFNGVSLDSALLAAAGFCTMYDSTGNDSLCVALMHQILMSELDRTNTTIRWKMDWARRIMQSALERQFVTSAISSEMNAINFHPTVQQYVDVLNVMSDETISDSTYREQFLLELGKAQLFRSIDNPWMARQILDEADACQLDSLEQQMVNEMISLVDEEMATSAEYNTGIPLDSLIFLQDSSSWITSTTGPLTQYFFGSYIASPTEVYFNSCLPEVRSLWTQRHSNDLLFYPNPSDGRFSFAYSGEDCLAPLKIMDVQGKIVWSETIALTQGAQPTFEIPRECTSGVYVVEIQLPNKILKGPVVVEK